MVATKTIALTDQEWNHIKAALHFWELTSLHSKIKPADHPKIRHWFSKYSPLSILQLIVLRMRDEQTVSGSFSIAAISNMTGWTVKRIRRWVKKLNIQPTKRIGRSDIYSIDDVMVICMAIKKQDDDYIRRNEKGFL